MYTTVDEESKWRDELTSTCIPIIPLTIRCENVHCTVTSIPLRVCKDLTIYKSQEMSVGPRSSLESTIIYLPEKRERTNTGSQLATTSPDTDISYLDIYDTNRQVPMTSLKKLEVVIVITKEKIDEMLQVKDCLSCQIVEENTTKLGDVSQNKDKTFTGRCEFLL